MTRRPPRLAEFSYLGFYRYSLTFCVERRADAFADPSNVVEALQQISIAATRHEFAIFVYCFMPDHLHLLAEGKSPRSDLVAFAHLLKQRTAFMYRRHHSCDLWQHGYFDHILRDDEMTHTVAKYILENPVRASLVREPFEYPFSGSLVYGRDQLVELWRSDINSG